MEEGRPRILKSVNAKFIGQLSVRGWLGFARQNNLALGDALWEPDAEANDDDDDDDDDAVV